MDIENLLDVPEGWSVVPLSSLVDPKRGISYGVVQPGQDVVDGVPIVRVGDLRQGRVDSAAPMRVAPEIVERYRRTRLTGGEVLLSLVGTVGAVAIAPPELAGWNTARAVAVIPPRADVDARWLAFCLRSPALQMLMASWCTTTVQATLNLKEVAQLPIPVPPRIVQDGIVQVLSALEDKLEVNRLTNLTLQQLASTLFRSWFVDFDPVVAKRDDTTPLGLPSEAIDLFPSHFEDSELGPIPQGWRIASLDSVAEFLNGLALQRYPPRDVDQLPVIKIAELRSGTSVGADRCGGVPIEYIIDDGDVVFSWSGSLMVDLWCGGKGALNQHLFKVTSNEVPKWFYLAWLDEHLPEFQAIAADKATTMGHIRRFHLTEAKVLLPPEPLMNAMTSVQQPLLDQIIHNRLESHTLAELRDKLLGPLLSGALTIRSAEHAAGATL